MTVDICSRRQQRSNLIISKELSSARTHQSPSTANIIHQTKLYYCIFQSILSWFWGFCAEKSRASKLRHFWKWAAQLISCQRGIVSLMMMTHDSSAGGGKGTQGFYIYINILTMCCVPCSTVDKADNWLQQMGKSLLDWGFLERIRHLVMKLCKSEDGNISAQAANIINHHMYWSFLVEAPQQIEKFLLRIRFY